ncbi:Crp/Fnr family transcriptional regulator [Bradyrhizobium sp. 44]|uniref:Crp/Fnr family transcriptional regulator n=1 Tax=unclassified Bradyrhizobium TaxID=2631580 RepID=UPI001FFA5097|nr:MULTISPECIES: Crp/Fnr family transcriptional regulator [unclassified Bradyrhizobium]MCK1288577.1 Crp/Fnr family transcriptional regulator [Bradyrhizobium sp. 44]UPJ43950.1 Crp/Fnr family transcriptional regulator [Bradyrhizobium sp. 40]
MVDLYMRPLNALLRQIEDREYKLFSSSLSLVECAQGETLYHPGDVVDTVYFPCGPTLISVTIATEEDRDVDAVLIGREGAIGGVGSGVLPSYSSVLIRAGGPVAKLPVRKLSDVKHQSDKLRLLLERYSEYFFAQQSQSAACNAAHSIEQRAAKWILHIIEHTGAEHITLTHERLAGLLGIGRSYLSRVIQGLKAEGILETARGEIRIRDRAALNRRSCACNLWLKKHYAKVVLP